MDWEIRFYEDQRGKIPVLEFINRLPSKDRARINNIFRLLESYGTMLGMPHARQIDGKLWELRPGGIRLFYFAHINRQFVILHGFQKKTDKTPKKEIEIAIRRMQALLEEA